MISTRLSLSVAAAKLAALVPAPRVHLVRSHGILGPAAAWRPLVIPTAANIESATVEGNPVPFRESVDEMEFLVTPTEGSRAGHAQESGTRVQLGLRLGPLPALRCRQPLALPAIVIRKVFAVNLEQRRFDQPFVGPK